MFWNDIPMTSRLVHRDVHELVHLYVQARYREDVTLPNVMPVSEFRAEATKLIKYVAANPGRRVYVGANRRPEAVLTSLATDMPFPVRQTLLDTFFSYLAEHSPWSFAADGGLLHIGDDFGGLFAWLWRADQNEAMDHLERYIRLIRASERPPRVQTLEEILLAMQFAADLTDEEYHAIRDRARKELADRFPDE